MSEALEQRFWTAERGDYIPYWVGQRTEPFVVELLTRDEDGVLVHPVGGTGTDRRLGREYLKSTRVRASTDTEKEFNQQKSITSAA